MLDCDLLYILLDKTNFQLYSPNLDLKLLHEDIRTVYSTLKKWHQTEDTDNKEAFVSYFFSKHLNFDEHEKLHYKQIFQKVYSLEPPDVDLTLDLLKKEKLWKDLEYIRKSEFDVDLMTKALDEYKEQRESTCEEDPDECPIHKKDFYLKTHVRPNGISYSLPWLEKKAGPMIGGDFILVFGYQNSGKSSFCANQAVCAAMQLTGEKKVLIFANEGKYEAYANNLKKIATGLPSSKLTELEEEEVIEYERNLYNGDPFRIILYKFYGKPLAWIKTKVIRRPPGMIIIDQIDNSLSDKVINSSRPYDKPYEYCRDLAKDLDVPVIGVTQSVKTEHTERSRDGEETISYTRWLEASHVFWSSVAKQAAVDVLIGIGFDKNTPDLRYLTIPRIKELKEGVSAITHKRIVQYDYKTARFIENEG